MVEGLEACGVRKGGETVRGADTPYHPTPSLCHVRYRRRLLTLAICHMTSCPVLTLTAIRTPYAMSGTDSGMPYQVEAVSGGGELGERGVNSMEADLHMVTIAVISAYACATRCQILNARVLYPCVCASRCV
eukprot:571341-Rhodomonas_salina.1